MAGTKGGKTKPGPDARTVAVKLSGAERALLARVVYTRIERGTPYDDTTQSAVVRDGIRLLAEKELGEELGEEQEGVAGVAGVEGVAAVSVGGPAEDLMPLLKGEYEEFCKAEGLENLPWEHFLTIRKLRMEKGGWKYGPGKA